MHTIRQFITGARTSWMILVLAAAGIAALMVWGNGSAGATSVGTGLPDSAESAQVARLQESLPSANSTAALVIYTRDDQKLSTEDLSAIADRGQQLARFSTADRLPPAVPSENGRAALQIVPLDVVDSVSDRADRAEGIRSTANAGLPDGVSAVMGGPEGFAVDVAAVFKGADFTLLLTTVIVVGVLLIITYRSPWLWLVPLIVVGLADASAGIVAGRIAGALSITLDASVTGILSVLVFGAGTNYALLLIARYREELRRTIDRREAMAKALKGAGPAIIASGGTVVLSLLTLVFASLTGNQALGIACAAGILVAMLFCLTVLPSALVLFGRRLFWPYIPSYGDADPAERGVWHRLGRAVSHKPVPVAVAGALLLAAMAWGAPSIQIGLAQTEKFTTVPEAVVAQNLIAESYPAGSGSPATITARPGYEQDIMDAAATVTGVELVTAGESTETVATFNATLSTEAETEASYAVITQLRDTLHAIPGADARVGGLDAQSLDLHAAQAADQALIIPLILLVVLTVLVVVLRSLVAPLLLLLTVVASFFASIGASWVLFTTVFGFPAFDTPVILFSFLFLVALGVDYNIFLVTRAREETAEHGTREGMIRALSATGGVITSAGILLAAVFAVLGVLPLITLTQIGIIVCLGVLVDTLLVRTVLVPALAFIAGEKFWWPARATGPARATEPARMTEPAPVTIEE